MQINNNNRFVKALLRMKRNWPLFVLMLPGLIYLFINNYMPIYGLTIAFKNVNYAKGFFQSDWAEPIYKNFKFLFRTKDAWIIMRNTLCYNLAFIILGTFMAILLALMIYEVNGAIKKKIYQTAMILPNLLSYVIVAYIIYAIFASKNGFANKSILLALGRDPINWYSETVYWPFILVITNLWKNAGYSSIVYLASISGINDEFYEAAKLDGASRMQQIRMITLPLIKPTIIMMTLLNVGKIFYSDFGLFYQVPMNTGVLFPVTQTIDTYVYRAMMETGNVAIASAAGFYQAVVGFVLVLAANLIVRRVSRENAMF